MNHNLPPSAKVLCVGEARAYFSKVPVLYSTAFDQHPLAGMIGGTNLLENLRAREITHVYINNYELDRLGRNYHYLRGLDWPIVQDVLEHHAQVVYRRGPYVVYKLEN
jgi:hypothetical protein